LNFGEYFMFRCLGMISKSPVQLKCTFTDKSLDSIEKSEFPSSGWGIGFYQHNSAYLVRKAASIIKDGQRLIKLSERIRSNVMMLHFRKATVGEIKEYNTHPFRYGQWLFAQHGAIENFRRVKPLLISQVHYSLRTKIKGVTDTEYCFYLLLSLLKGSGYLRRGEIPYSRTLEAFHEMGVKVENWHSDVKSPNPNRFSFFLTNGSFFMALNWGIPLYYLSGEVIDSPLSLNSESSPLNLTFFQEDPGAYVLLADGQYNPEYKWSRVPDRSIISINENLVISIHPVDL